MMLGAGGLLRAWVLNLATDDEHHARLRETCWPFSEPGGATKRPQSS
jgi:hypothetical protein